MIAGMNSGLKLIIKQARPAETCLSSCGMPSSHAATATALLLYLILDAAHRIKQRRSDTRESFFPSWASISDTCVKMIKGAFVIVFGTMSQREFSTYMTIWSLLLLPVPISRAILNDHYPSQIMAGCFMGIVACIIWYPLVLSLRIKFQPQVGTKFLYIFVHNYDVPIGWGPAIMDEDEKATNEPLVAAETTSSV